MITEHWKEFKHGDRIAREENPKYRQVIGQWHTYDYENKAFVIHRFESHIIPNGEPLSLQQKLEIVLKNPDFAKYLNTIINETVETLANFKLVE